MVPENIHTKLNWNFRRGGGVMRKIPSVGGGGGGGGGYGYFVEPHNKFIEHSTVRGAVII